MTTDRRFIFNFFADLGESILSRGKGRAESAPLEFGGMGKQQMLLVIAGVIVVGIAVVVGITMFQSSSRTRTLIAEYTIDPNFTATGQIVQVPTSGRDLRRWALRLDTSVEPGLKLGNLVLVDAPDTNLTAFTNKRVRLQGRLVQRIANTGQRDTLVLLMDLQEVPER